ncbi:uncharacterized protein LOC144471541 [Augochlora pura]
MFQAECTEVRDQGRNFRRIADEEFPEVLDFLDYFLPESLKFHQTLLTHYWEHLWDFHFYVANDWPEQPICLHFPGMTKSPHGSFNESLGVFCPKGQLDLLQLVWKEDVLIDWSKPLYINFVHNDIAEELSRLYEDTGTIERVVGDLFICPDPQQPYNARSEDEEDPDVEVMPLRAEHAEFIHNLYPANDMECQQIFRLLIKSMTGCGVFVKGDLAAWMVQSYYGAMFSMQTMPQYRRKGYGTRLVRYLTKWVADRGYKPFVVIRPENEASQSLYKKLGFKKLYQMVRMTFTPTSWQEEPEAEVPKEEQRGDPLHPRVRSDGCLPAEDDADAIADEPEEEEDAAPSEDEPADEEEIRTSEEWRLPTRNNEITRSIIR